LLRLACRRNLEHNTCKTRLLKFTFVCRECLSCKNTENKTPDAIPVVGVKLKRGYYVFWLFFKIEVCSAPSFKRSRRKLSIDVAEHRSILKKKVKCVFWSFFKIGLCSATSMESFRRDPLNDGAEHRPILKNYQNTYYPRFSFLPKTGEAFLKTGALFSLCRQSF